MTAKESTVTEVSPDSPAAVQLLAELDAHLHEHPYPPESRHAFSVEQLLHDRVAFFVTRCDGDPAACGGVKLFHDYGEVKRMYVRPPFRGLGLGKAMLQHLGAYTRASGIKILRLETGIYQIAALGLYERSGFKRRPPFGEYREDPLSVYFEKVLE